MNTYLIYGNDYSLIKREIENIIGGALDVVRYDLSVSKIDELLDDASCISLFGDEKVLIGENALFLTSANTNVNHNIDYLENYVKDQNHDNIVILTILDKLDERKKIVKLLKQKVTVIKKDEIDERDLTSFVIEEFKSKGYIIDSKCANYFISYVGKNVDILISEINKMIIYKNDDKKIEIKDIDHISSRGFKDNIFDLSNAILNKNHKEAFECYNDLIKTGEEPIRILALLASQFSLIYESKLLSESGKDSKTIAEVLKVHPYRVKLALESKFVTEEVKDIIKNLHELDYEIKSGKTDKNIGLENFLIHI